jgi:hypothetical protein
VLASEIYSIVRGVNIAIIINITIKIITKQLGFSQTLIVVCTDLYLLYKCLVKLGNTQKKAPNNRYYNTLAVIQAKKDHRDLINQ